jgi:hypothetical protein
MRSENPNGAGLGAVSNVEGDYLRSTIASLLEQAQTEDQVQYYIKAVSNAFKEIAEGTEQQLEDGVKAGRITRAQKQEMLDRRYDLTSSVPAGIPVTKEQFDKMAPGTEYIAPDGTRRTKPGAK